MSIAIFKSYYLTHPDVDWACIQCSVLILLDSFFENYQITQPKHLFNPDSNRNSTEIQNTDTQDYLTQFGKNIKKGKTLLNLGQLNIRSLRTKLTNYGLFWIHANSTFWQ